MKKFKNIFITVIFLILAQTSFSQYWQGYGTEQSPFEIWTIEDLNKIREHEDDFTIIYPWSGPYENKHFALMQNIDEPLERGLVTNFFNGNFHGKGHYITLDITNIPNTTPEYDNQYLITRLFGIIDSLTLKGNIYNMISLILGNFGKISHVVCDLETISPCDEVLYLGLCQENSFSGIIEYCTNNSDINFSDYNGAIGSFFANNNLGIINTCINNGNIYCSSQYIQLQIFSLYNDGQISNCINHGDIEIQGVPNISYIGCFAYGHALTRYNYVPQVIENCLNTGNITAKKCDYVGIIAGLSSGRISNCLNIGTLIGEDIAGGIVGQISYDFNRNSTIENCLNAGNVRGNYLVGGIFGSFYNPNYRTGSIVVKNNLSLSRTSKYAIIGDTTFSHYLENIDRLEFSNNFYDKQLVTIPATAIGDITENNAAKGLLTSEITGFALQSILGNGWSYAEGRYPIPLGLEHHPAALLAATPIYLPYEDTEHYNTVDSVTCHFTLGTENTVEWEVAGNKVELLSNGETLHGILQDRGYEMLTVTLGDFTREIWLDIRSICVPIITHTISGRVTSNGTPLEGVEIAYSGTDWSRHVSTNANGEYSFSVLVGSTVTISPTLIGYEFSPTDTIITNITENITNVNFAANLIGVPVETGRAPSLQIYPNPANDKITITTTDNFTTYDFTIDNLQLQIFNLTGRVVSQLSNGKLSNSQLTIDVSHLQPGVYFVKFILQGTNEVQKFVKE